MPDRNELEEKVWGIYCNGLDEDAGFYAREAEDAGLVAVYNAGLEAGRAESRRTIRTLKKTPCKRCKGARNEPGLLNRCGRCGGSGVEKN